MTHLLHRDVTHVVAKVPHRISHRQQSAIPSAAVLLPHRRPSLIVWVADAVVQLITALASRPRSRRVLAKGVVVSALLAFLLLLSTATTQASGIVVNTLIDDNTANGLCSLREAIVAANGNVAFNGCASGSGSDTITFSVTGTIQLSSALPNLTSSMTIQGPGAQQLTVRRNVGGDYRIFTIEAGVVSIEGLTITNGLAHEGGGIRNAGILLLQNAVLGTNAASSAGGGLFNAGSAALTNVLFQTNTATYGGGVYHSNTPNQTLVINGSTFANNGASIAGGAIDTYGVLTVNNSTLQDNLANERGGGITATGIVTLTNTIVRNNRALGTAVGNGHSGGIWNRGSMTINGGSINLNTSLIRGGGIQNDAGASLTIIGTQILSNEAEQAGGALYNFGTATLTNVFIGGNEAVRAGGIHNEFPAVLTLNASTLSLNRATEAAGGIDNNNAQLVINDSTFVGNTAPFSAALLNRGTATLTNSTVSGNTASVETGGIGNTSGDTLNLNNVTVFNNTAPAAAGIRNDGTLNARNSILANGCQGTITNLGGNLANQVCGALPVIANLLLSPLGNFGGPTFTHVPLIGSPVINAGANGNVPTGVTTDQRGAGFPRILNGSVDSGAVEALATAANPPANVNLIANGDFSQPVAQTWGFWGVNQQVVNGALHVTRTAEPAGGFYQFVAQPAAPAAPFELTFRMGNNSATVKTLNVMVRGGNWEGVRNCVFNVAPFAPMQNYTMQFINGANLNPIVFQGWITADTNGSLIIDDLNLQYKPSLSVLGVGTNCRVEPPANTNLVFNGDFSAAATSTFGFFGGLEQTVENGTLRIWNTAQSGQGGLFQFNPYSAPGNGTLEFTFKAGNTGTFRTLTVLLRTDWSTPRICFIGIPPSAPLTPLTIRARVPASGWSNIIVQMYVIQPGGSPSQAVLLDDLNLQYKVPPVTINSPSDVDCPTFPTEAAPLAEATGLVSEGVVLPPPTPFVLPENAIVAEGGISPLPTAAPEAAPAEVPVVEEPKS